MITGRKQAKQILNQAGGYLSGYSHTLNPYGGCAFACKYCYVREMPIALFNKQPWGQWVDVKENAAELLHRELTKAKQKGPVTIFMSSSTDPYQQVEYKERLTRSLLEVMTECPPDFLFVQTRSPLVTRDVDLLHKLEGRVRVSITVETDRKEIRQAFTPSAPTIASRLRALAFLREQHIPTQATIAPVLPCSDHFAEKLASIVDKVCLDDFFMGDGSKGRRTEKLGIQSLYAETEVREWYSRDAYLKVLAQLKHHFTEEQIYISQAGFLPDLI